MTLGVFLDHSNGLSMSLAKHLQSSLVGLSIQSILFGDQENCWEVCSMTLKIFEFQRL